MVMVMSHAGLLGPLEMLIRFLDRAPLDRAGVLKRSGCQCWRLSQPRRHLSGLGHAQFAEDHKGVLSSFTRRNVVALGGQEHAEAAERPGFPGAQAGFPEGR